MASSKATTVSDYLLQLSEDRREAISRVRDVVRAKLPGGYEEVMGGGMITWAIPLSTYPDTYNGQPLCIAALASQKNYCSLYLMGPYGDPRQLKMLQEGFTNAGKKLDMGKSCVRFRSADDLPLDVIGNVIAMTPAQKLIEAHERARTVSRTARRQRTTGTKVRGRKKTGK